MGPRIKDWSGKTFYDLTFLAPTRQKKSGAWFWMAQCSCGNLTEVIPAAVINGSIKSCGCLAAKRGYEWSQSNIKDITGQRFGRLVALESLGTSLRRPSDWKCQCDCGETIVTTVTNLLNGTTKSCGCLQKEKARTIGIPAASKAQRHYDGTHIGLIDDPKIRSNNTSGVPGVSYISTIGYWRASIRLRGKIYQSSFNTKEKAVAWRKMMEAKLFHPIIEQYNKEVSCR